MMEEILSIYAGIGTLPQGMIYALDEAVPISTIVGTANTTLSGIVTVLQVSLMDYRRK